MAGAVSSTRNCIAGLLTAIQYYNACDSYPGLLASMYMNLHVKLLGSHHHSAHLCVYVYLHVKLFRGLPSFCTCLCVYVHVQNDKTRIINTRLHMLSCMMMRVPEISSDMYMCTYIQMAQARILLYILASKHVTVYGIIVYTCHCVYRIAGNLRMVLIFTYFACAFCMQK